MYSLEGIDRGIEKCRENIRIFEDAIEKEQATIRELRSQKVKVEEREAAIEAAKKNVNIEVDDG